MTTFHRLIRRPLPWLAVLALLVPALSSLAAGQGRLQAQVVDSEGNPVADVEVVVTQPTIGYSKTLKTDRRGRFTLLVLDAARVYDFEFNKAGMPKTSQSFKIEIDSVTRHTFTMAPQGAVAAPGATVTAGRGRAIETFNEGVAALQAGDRATARERFEATLEIDPDMPQPYAVLGSLYLEAGEHDRAIAAAETLLELSPDHPTALIVLYDAHRGKGDPATAQPYLDRLSATGGGSEVAVRLFNAAADAAGAGNLDTALILFGKAIENDPELAPAHAEQARLLLVSERWEEAASAAERALALDPDLVAAQRVRYDAYRQLGRDDEAAEVFQQLAAADPAGLAQTLYQRGHAAFEAGDTATALQALEQAVQAQPDHARAHYMLGLSYANAGDSAKAKQHLQKFVDLAPNDPEAGAAREMISYLG